MGNSAVTLPMIAGRLEDQFILSTPVFAYFDSLRQDEGGADLRFPQSFGADGTVTDVGTSGTAFVPAAFTDNEVTTVFNWARTVHALAIPKKVLEENKDKKYAKIDIRQKRLANGAQYLRETFEKRILTGASNAKSSLETLNGMGCQADTVRKLDATSANTSGWLEGAAPGSQTNSIGGLSKSTYRSEGWYNQYKTSGGTFALSHLDELINQTMIESADNTPADTLICSMALYNKIKSLIDAKVQIINLAAKRDGLSANVVEWNGVKLIPSLYMGFNNAAGTPVSAYLLHSKHIFCESIRDNWLGIENPVDGITANKDAMIYGMNLHGQIATDRPRSLGVLLNAES